MEIGRKVLEGEVYGMMRRRVQLADREWKWLWEYTRIGSNASQAARVAIRERTLFSNEVENYFVVTVVTYVTAGQLSIPHHTSDIWPTLKNKIPLAFNLVVHLFLSSLHLLISHHHF